MEQWKEYRLEEIGTVVGGATPSTKDTTNYDGEIPWITPKDLSNHNDRYIYRGERMITQKGFESCSCKMLPKGSVLFSSRAPIGYVAIAGTDMCTNQGFKSVVPNNEIVDTHFLYYLLLFNKAKIEGMGSGTTFKEVSGNVMKSVTVSIPNLTEQKRIADFLSSLDDKIELNRQINDNLEQQAQALFKSWFVDFEPFKDGEFVDSELGMIPKGWEIVPLGDMVSVIDNRGKTPPLSECSTKFPIIDVKALSGTHRIINYSNCSKYVTEDIYNSFFRSGHPDKYDILLSTVGSLAELKIYMINKGTIAQNVVALRSKYPLYLYQYLFNKKGDLISYNIGSVQPSIKVTHIVKYAILLPPKETIINFENILNSLTNQILKNENECQSLESIRDTLLPRLMSGELKINEINC